MSADRIVAVSSLNGDSDNEDDRDDGDDGGDEDDDDDDDDDVFKRSMIHSPEI